MLRAGASKQALNPRIGADLLGYSQEQPTTGIHDDICSRALALQDQNTTLVLCSVDVCILLNSTVQAIRKLITEQHDVRPENISIFATHTHSSPAIHNQDGWDESPIDTIVNVILNALNNLQPATIGYGTGFLYGYSINRRWLERPIDPAVGVIRVDDIDGSPIAILSNFANHGVVLGYDNLLISGDWMGYSSRLLEAEFGENFVALFAQGGAGDINPLTKSMREKLDSGESVQSIGNLNTYYGDNPLWNIGDRKGGTFAEAELISIAFNREVKRVWQSIHTSREVSLWTHTLNVEGALSNDEPPIPKAPSALQTLIPDNDKSSIALEIMLIGIGRAIIVGHCGETFSENAVAFRRLCQQMGYDFAMLITNVNGWVGYLPPENAFIEGGYEIDFARYMGISRYTQQRIIHAITPLLKHHLSS